MNAIDMLALVRDYMGETAAAHWTNLNIMRRINMSHRRATMLVSETPGGWLTTSTDLTPVASVITLPSDCAKPIYLEETSSGMYIPWLDGGVKARRVTRTVGASYEIGYREAYPLMNTIEVNEASYTTGVTLWYQKRIPDLVIPIVAATGATGVASAGAATSITIPANDPLAKKVADYYNGVTIEITGGTGVNTVTTVSDYTAAGVFTTAAGTFSTDTVYGTVSLLPEEANEFIVLDAALMCLAKPDADFNEDAFNHLRAMRKEAKNALDEWIESRIPGGGVAIGDMSI